MAASKSWSGDAGVQPRPKKYFTLAEATRALPLVRRIVGDIVRMHEEATVLHGELEAKLSLPRRDAVQNELERAVDRLGDLIDELKQIGCEIKDYRVGLIDFVSKYQGRDIYLCWKLGESAIDFWHELHAGLQGRQPVSELTN